MQRVTVYKFRKYDIEKDEFLASQRWATIEAIKRFGGEAFLETAVEIDKSDLNADGMTERAFDPGASRGFQRQVKI